MTAPTLPTSQHIVYYRGGLSSTVSVHRERDNLFLRVNGKTDASTTDDMPTQLMLGHLPLLVHPAPKSGEMWQLPLLLYDAVHCLDGCTRTVDIWEELRQLRLLRSPSTQPVSFQIGTETFTAFVDDYENHPHHIDWARGSYNSTCLVKLKILTGVTA